MDKGSMTVGEAGRKGGEAVKAKYGRDLYIRAGKLGGASVAKRGREYYAEIGRKGAAEAMRRHGHEFYRRIGRLGGLAEHAKPAV